MRKKVKQTIASVLVFLLIAIQFPGLPGEIAYAAASPIISTVAGNGSAYSGDGGPALSAGLGGNLRKIAFDNSGNLYVAAQDNNRVRKVDTSGIITTVAGMGSAGYSGDGGPATSAELSGLWGVAIDSNGNLYIADSNNNRIRKVNTSGIITTVAGNGSAGYSGDGGSATSAQLSAPTGLTIDSNDNLYIADSQNNRIRKVDTSGIITTVAGTGSTGYSGDGGAATSARLYSPMGLAFDNGGNLYITDYGNGVIRKVDTSGIITTAAGSGDYDYTGDGGPATSAALSDPQDIVFDSIGNLYIADMWNNVIRKVDTSGNITTVAGNGTVGYSGDGGSATSAQLSSPYGVAIDSIGNLYISDYGRIRKVGLSNDVSLSSLTLSSGSLSPAFAPGTTGYTASVASNVSSITVTPTLKDSSSTVTVNGTAVTSGSASGVIALDAGSSTIAVVVTSQDGAKTQTYTVTVTRAVSLNSLTLSSGSLSPLFAPDTTSYTASVANSVSSITLTPTVSDSTAMVKVNGTAVTSGSASEAIGLNAGSSPITVVVASQDGTATQTYTVTVTRESSSNADLSGLTLSVGSLSPDFSSAASNYTASVANSVSSITVTPTASDSGASITVNGTLVPSGSASAPISLNVGSNAPIIVVVTAQDATTQTYTVTVTRAPASSIDASLSSLMLSSGSLSPTFSSGTASYTASVANSVYGITVIPTVSDSSASVTVNGLPVPSGSASDAISLNVGSNTIMVVGTAQDGTTTQTYTITVMRASVSAANADLSSLTLPFGSLSPAFAVGTTSYTASVANNAYSITVTPVLSDSNASVKINGTSVADGSTSGPISLNVGSNIITVVVTAQDGTPKSYTVTVTRASSSNASLSSLTLSSGSLSPVFAPGTTSYTASVASSMNSIRVTPTVSDHTSTVTVGGNAVSSGSASGAINLNAGSNLVVVVVTAQDGSTQTYRVTVEKMLDAPTGLTAMAGNGQVTLSWSGVAGASTYNVYQGTVPGNHGAAPMATVSGVTNSYTATGLTNGTRYYFVVQASSAGGNSNDSNEASAMPQATITPADLFIRTAAPVTGAAQADGTNTYHHAAAVVTWAKAGGSYAPASGNFALKTTYTTKYVLSADAGYSFDPAVRVYEQGKAKDLTSQITNLGSLGTFTATVSTQSSSNDTLTVIVTWPETYQNLAIVKLDNIALASFIKANYSGNAIPAEGINIPGENDFSIELVNTSADTTVSPLQLTPALIKSIQAVDDRGRNVLVSVTPNNQHSAWGLNLNIKGDYGQTDRTVTITVLTSAAHGIDTSSVSNFTSTIDYADSSRTAYPNQYDGMKYFAAGDQLSLTLFSNGIVPGGVQFIGTRTSKAVDLTTQSMDVAHHKFLYSFVMPDEPVKLVVNSTTDPNSPHNIKVKATVDNVVHPVLSGGTRFAGATGGSPATDYLGDKVTIDLSEFEGQNASQLYKITGVNVKSAFTNESLPVTQNAALVYSFIMPYNDVTVTILVEKIPGYVISTQVRSNASAKVVTNVEKYFPGGTLSVTITNTSSRAPLKDVRFIRKSDNYTQTVTLDKDSDNYSSTINISKVVIPASTVITADDEITVVAEFSYDPGIPVNTTSNTGVTFAATPSVVQMSRPFTFSVKTPTDVFDSYTAQVIVTDKTGAQTTFNAMFESQDSSDSDISIYSVNSDIYASGRPKSITIAVNGVKNPKSKVMTSISPNSQLASLFHSIIVSGRHMDQDGEVYMGTAPNPTQRAVVSNVTSSSLTVTVPQNLLPPKNSDVTYYVSVNGAQKAITVKSIETLSHTTFGVLAVAADGSNNKSVIVAANDAELNRLLGNKTKILAITGKVSYDPNANKYTITGTSIINSMVTSYLTDSDSSMTVTASRGGDVTVEAYNVKMLAGGMTFVTNADVAIALENGIQYIDTYAKNPETGELLDSNTKNVELEFKHTVGVIALGSGLGAKIGGAFLLKDSIMFEGKVNMGVTKPGGGQIGFFVDAKRLEFGKDQKGDIVFKGTEAEGTISPPEGFSNIIPGFKQSEAVNAKIDASVNTYEKEYGLGFDLNAKIGSFSSKLRLKQNSGGTFIPDTVKIIMGLKKPGIPVTPATPVGHITKIGGGFSGLADTISGNYDAIPPVTLLLNGEMVVGDVGEKALLSFEDMELSVGPSQIQLSGNPVLLGVDVFDKFQAGIYLKPSSVSFDVAADAAFLKNFQVIKGKGHANVTLNSDSSYDVNGRLNATIQVPEIDILSTPFGDLTIGPKTLANMDVGMSKTDAYAAFRILGHGLGVHYNYQSGDTGVSLLSVERNGIQNTLKAVDETGSNVGKYQVLPNISLVATSVPKASGTKANKVTAVSVSNQPTISTNDSSTVHTITMPEGILRDYAILVSADPNDISVQDPNGNLNGLTYPRILDDGSMFYNDPDANAEIVSDRTASKPGTVMINLGREPGNWMISSSRPFASAVIVVNPIPEIDSTTYAAESNTVNFALTGLDTAKESYRVEVRLSKDSGEDRLNASPGVLINTIPIDPASVMSGGASGSYTFKPEGLTYLQSGGYYPRLTLIAVPKSNPEGAIPYSSINAKQPLMVTNPLAPGSISSVSVKAGGGGAIEAKWNAVSNADGYLVSLNDDQGQAVMSPLTYTDEIDNQGNLTGNDIPHPGTAIEYNITADQAVNGVFTLDFGGMQAGSSYKLAVTPYARVESHDTYSPVIYGNPTVSNLTFVPVPDYPIIHVSADTGSMTTNVQRINVLAVNGNFQLGISSTHVNQADGTGQSMTSRFTVSQSDGTYNDVTGMPNFTILYSGSAFENQASVPVSISDTNPSSIIHIVAENHNGDKSSYELVVNVNDLPPALFVNTEANGSIYTDANGKYQVQGSTLPNITVMDNFANQVVSDRNGNFTINGTLSSGSRAYSTITAMDAAGNFAQDDVVISRTASGTGSGPTTSGNAGDTSPRTSQTNTAPAHDTAPTEDTTPSSGSVKSVFHDVHMEAPWAEAAIDQAHKLGIVKGRTPTAFEPNGHTRRDEAIVMLVRAKKLDIGDKSALDTAAAHFADWDSVPEWGKPYLAAAYVSGLINGSLINGAYYVRAESDVTRAELAVLIQNAYKLKFDDQNLKSFNDTLPAWASESIAALASNKVINGYPDGTFKPDSSATRAEVVVMLMNIFNQH